MSRLINHIAFLVLVISVLAFVVNAQIQVPYSFCGTANDLFNISNVTSNEWPPSRDSDLVVLFDGWVLENVTDGSYEIVVKWEGIELYDEKGDITSLLKNQTLPIANGTYCYLTKAVDIPSEAPAGSYSVQVSAWDVNGKEFTCFLVKFSFSELIQPAPTPGGTPGLMRPIPLPPTPNPPPTNPPPTFPEEEISSPMTRIGMKVPGGVANYKRRNSRGLL